MNKKSILFITLCMVLCLIPSVGMLFFPTTRTTENKAMAPAPQLMTEEGSFNKAFFQDFESWFTERVALRNVLLAADGYIQSGIFQESNVSGVMDGTDGWLYYSSTLSDYRGEDVMTDRELYNLAHNIGIVQEYAESKGMGFVFTIAPNKNTLYPEYMPYYKSQILNADHSAKLLAPYLEDVNYLDLFQMFENTDEVLYLKRDSHWNNKGAYMAYEAMMDMLELPHEALAEPEKRKAENGDLNKMLYSFYGPLEENYYYDLPGNFVYEKEGATVEDGWIVTNNSAGSGSLLMFRDSFANTLIPFFSERFETAYYSKGMPNALERFVETYGPDQLIIQKVERNISDYLDNPPILTPPTAELPENLILASTATTAQVESSMNDVNYYTFSGTLDAERMEEESQVLVAVNGTVYRAYQTGEDGFLLYLKTADFPTGTADVQVYIVNGDTCIQALYETLELPAV